MDPLNKQERSEAIIKVLVYYIIAVVLIGVPMYFIFSLPETESVWNEKEFRELTQQMEGSKTFEKDFLAKTDSAISLFEAFKSEKDEMVQNKIQLRYSDITNQMEDNLKELKNDTIRANLYDNIIYTFNNMFTAWMDLYQVKDELETSKSVSQDQKQQLAEKSQQVQEEKSKTLQEKEIDLIKKALDKHNGSVRDAAKDLGTTERKLRKRMKDLGIG